MEELSYQLVVRRGPKPGEVFHLTLSTVIIGRDPMSDIVINDPEVSRNHCRFSRVDSSYEIQDMGSTNGTFVDGKRLRGEPITVHDGSTITLGSNVTLVFQAGSDADPMATVLSSESAAPAEEEDELRPSFPPERTGRMAAVDDVDVDSDDFDEDPDDWFSSDEADSEAYEDLPQTDALESRPINAETPPFDDLPSFDESTPVKPQPAGTSITPPERENMGGGFTSPPPPPPIQGDEGGNNTRRYIIIGVVVVLLLCCCCLLLTVVILALGDGTYWTVDWLFNLPSGTQIGVQMGQLSV